MALGSVVSRIADVEARVDAEARARDDAVQGLRAALEGEVRREREAREAGEQSLTSELEHSVTAVSERSKALSSRIVFYPKAPIRGSFVGRQKDLPARSHPHPIMHRY